MAGAAVDRDAGLLLPLDRAFGAAGSEIAGGESGWRRRYGRDGDNRAGWKAEQSNGRQERKRGEIMAKGKNTPGKEIKKPKKGSKKK